VPPSAIAFYLLASLCVVSAIMVVTRRSAIHAALFLVLTFFGVAGIYVVMSAEFLAATQVLVYAGGIMVLFLFVIMLVPLEARALKPPVGQVAGALLLSALLAGVLISYFWNAGSRPYLGAIEPLTQHGGNMQAVGMELYRRYLLPFEVASVTLLVAMIGAIVLTRKKV
jgi:NADH-quinone oxidoreductase subunit J